MTNKIVTRHSKEHQKPCGICSTRVSGIWNGRTCRGRRLTAWQVAYLKNLMEDAPPVEEEPLPGEFYNQ